MGYFNVEIDDSDLADAGYHHLDNCVTTVERDWLMEIIGDLHRQAHPGKAHEPGHCFESPCRDLLRGPPTATTTVHRPAAHIHMPDISAVPRKET